MEREMLKHLILWNGGSKYVWVIEKKVVVFVIDVCSCQLIVVSLKSSMCIVNPVNFARSRIFFYLTLQLRMTLF